MTMLVPKNTVYESFFAWPGTNFEEYSNFLATADPDFYNNVKIPANFSDYRGPCGTRSFHTFNEIAHRIPRWRPVVLYCLQRAALNGYDVRRVLSTSTFRCTDEDVNGENYAYLLDAGVVDYNYGLFDFGLITVGHEGIVSSMHRAYGIGPAHVRPSAEGVRIFYPLNVEKLKHDLVNIDTGISFDRLIVRLRYFAEIQHTQATILLSLIERANARVK